MGVPLKIKEDRSPAELRRLARRERDGRVAARLYAIANALDGMSRAATARLAGMERQALRDAVMRYNAEDLAGLRDRPKGHPQRRLTEGEEATLAAVILRGPAPERDGCCAWTRADLCCWMAAHFGKTYHPSSMTRVDGVLATEGAPRPPAARRESAAALPKKGLRAALNAAAEAHPGKRLQLWFQDEARVGNKGRVCHRWWLRGERAPGLAQQGYQWAYIFSAIRPTTGEDFTLVLPLVNAAMMNLFLTRFAAALPADVHAVLVLDGAGWHHLALAQVDGPRCGATRDRDPAQLSLLRAGLHSPRRCWPGPAGRVRHDRRLWRLPARESSWRNRN